MQRFTILFIAILFFSACTRTIGVKDLGTVFIPDPNDPQLPAYSETGMNTLGAYHNNKPWTSNNNGFGSVVVGYEQDSIIVGLRGAPGFYEVKFLIPKHTVGRLEDLVFLNDSTFDLSDSNFKVKIDNDLIKIQSGNFSIKRCRKLVVNSSATSNDQYVNNGVIISGTFDLSGSGSNGPVALSKGRFDLVVVNEDFVRNYWF